MTRAERLNPLDAGFFDLESEFQQLHVGSLLILEGPPPTDAEFSGAIEARLDRLPRYRQRIQRVPLDLGRPVWVDDASFRIRDHIRRTTLRPPGGERALRHLAERVMSEALDLSRPPWQSWLVRGLAGGRWAMVNKTHHAMIDGISGADVLDVILDGAPDRGSPERPTPPAAWSPRPAPTPGELVVDALRDAVSGSVDLGRAARRALQAPAGAVRAATTRLHGLEQVGRTMTTPATVLTGPIGPRRRWGWVRGDLREVKQVKGALGGTVNDVMLAAVAGGLRTFLVSRGEPVDGRTVRSMVPVSMRRPDQHGTLGNEVSAVFAELPVGLADPAQRLATVTTELSALKRSGIPVGMDSLLSASGLLPGTLFALVWRTAAHLPQVAMSTVTTNVPGSPVPLYLLGRRLLEVFPYIPLGEQVRITVGIASYAGAVTVGVTGDRDSVPDLDVLLDGIDHSLRELVALASPR